MVITFFLHLYLSSFSGTPILIDHGSGHHSETMIPNVENETFSGTVVSSEDKRIDSVHYDDDNDDDLSFKTDHH